MLIVKIIGIINGSDNDELVLTLNIKDDIQILLPDEKTGAYMFVSNDEATDSDKYDNGNLIDNPSFEDGLWTEEVGDCHNHDDNPILSMEQSDNASDGSKSLELQATRHIACTAQKDINVEGGGIFLLKFDYQSDNAKNAGYYISFDDTDKTNISGKLPIENNEWNTFEKQITVPSGANEASLFVYSYAEDDSKESDDSENIITRYDNFYLVKMPDVHDKYYYLGEFDGEIKNPTKIVVESDGDNKKSIHLSGATTSFFLVTDNTYNDGWKLQLKNGTTIVPDKYHFESSGYKNGWYINTGELCGTDENSTDECVKNDDGSYSIELVMKYDESAEDFKLGLCFWNGIIIYLALIWYVVWDISDRKRRRKKAFKDRLRKIRNR